MSNVSEIWYTSGQGYKLDCGHTGFNISNHPRYEVGDKIPCDICAEIKKAFEFGELSPMQRLITMVDEINNEENSTEGIAP